MLKDIAHEKLYRMPLSLIRTNKNNPRKNFSGKKFDDLMESIRTKGVIEPIILRPKTSSPKYEYEIVAGERRFRAALQISKDPATDTIPSIVRELTNMEAFDFMTIENLQREDLTPLEEAESFKTYIVVHGPESVIDLAERIGILASYIRRRVRILELPKNILAAWEKGMAFGYLEQFLRIKDKKFLKDTFAKYENSWFHSVGRLKNHISEKSPSLTKASFDLKKTGCLTCDQNSDVQKKLFDFDGMKGAQCLNPNCFKRNQNNHFLKNWKTQPGYKKYGTTGFRFEDDCGYEDHETFIGDYYTSCKPAKKCKSCKDFVSRIDLYGKIETPAVCIGPKQCYREVTKITVDPATKEEKAGPRVDWHGEYFREQFLKIRLPAVYKTIARDKERQLQFFALVSSDYDLQRWLEGKLNGANFYLSDTLFKRILKMNWEEVRSYQTQAAIEHIMGSTKVSADCRRRIAEDLGINFKKEWAADEEYLNKKTKKELCEFGEKSKIFKDKKVLVFLATIKRKKFTACKKSELVDIFLKSGVNLVGKVPEEILKYRR